MYLRFNWAFLQDSPLIPDPKQDSLLWLLSSMSILLSLSPSSRSSEEQTNANDPACPVCQSRSLPRDSQDDAAALLGGGGERGSRMSPGPGPLRVPVRAEAPFPLELRFDGRCRPRQPTHPALPRPRRRRRAAVCAAVRPARWEK